MHEMGQKYLPQNGVVFVLEGVYSMMISYNNVCTNMVYDNNLKKCPVTYIKILKYMYIMYKRFISPFYYKCKRTQKWNI